MENSNTDIDDEDEEVAEMPEAEDPEVTQEIQAFREVFFNQSR